MGRPSKAVEVLKNEGKSHRTKAELNKREAEEQALLTGIKMRESPDVKADKNAHKEFKRVAKLLASVGKNDALYEAVINDYCLLEADIIRCRRLRAEIAVDPEVTGKNRYELIDAFDRKIERYRKNRRDIERENGMTIASAMRSIPKTPPKKGNPLVEALSDDEP